MGIRVDGDNVEKVVPRCGAVMAHGSADPPFPCSTLATLHGSRVYLPSQTSFVRKPRKFSIDWWNAAALWVRNVFYSDVCRYKIVFRGSIVRSGNECPQVNTKESGSVIIFEIVTKILGSERFTWWLIGHESNVLISPLPLTGKNFK